MIDVSTHRVFWTVHKYAGLTACAWLFVVAITGIFLDHHEWRWLNQNSVSSSLTSTQIGRLAGSNLRNHSTRPATVIGWLSAVDQPAGMDWS